MKAEDSVISSGKNLWFQKLGFICTVVLLIIFLGSWVLSSPVGSSPDDDFHLSSIWCANNGHVGMCEKSNSAIEMEVSSSLLNSPCFAYDVERSANCQLEKNIFEDKHLQLTSVGNFNGGYPPLYYSVMGLFAYDDVQFSVIFMRFINVLLFVFLFVVLWISSDKSSRFTQKYIWLFTLIPFGIFLISSNNPSSWAIIGIGFGAVSLQSFFRALGKTQVVAGSVFILSTMISSGSRGDGAFYMALTTISISLINLKFWRKKISKLLISCISLSISIFYFFSSSQSTGVVGTGFGNVETGRSSISVFSVNILRLPDLFFGLFGKWGLGWQDTPMAELVWATPALVISGLVFYSLQMKFSKLHILQIAIIVLLVTLPLYVLQKTLSHVGEYLQPRYLLPLFVLFVFVTLEILSKNSFEFSTISKTFIWLGLSAANGFALYLNLLRYTNGIGINHEISLWAHPEWWWPGMIFGPEWVFGVGSISFVALTFILLFVNSKTGNSIRSKEVFV